MRNEEALFSPNFRAQCKDNRPVASGIRVIHRLHRRLLVRVGVVFLLFSAIVSLAGCDTFDRVASDRQADRDQESRRGQGGDSVDQLALDTPAVTPLSIPELLEPTFDEEGVAHYDLTIGKSHHDYRQTAMTDTYSYNGMSVLGPTLRLRTGDSVVISVTNELDETTTTHWHGADLPAEDDGGPHSLIEPGKTWVADFDVIQPAATLWYHPHPHGSTAEHVYRGAAGLIIIDDDNPAATALPAAYGIDDIPVIIQDRDFTDDGQLDFAIVDDEEGNLDGVLTVNGTINPYVAVPTGLVRLRLLNGSQARIYHLSVEGANMTKIASDGGYLASPVVLKQIVLAPGDRVEIIINVGLESAALVDSTLGRVLELRPNGTTSGTGMLPDKLAVIERISESEITVDRSFHMDEVDNFWDSDAGWAINDLPFEMSRIDVTVQLGDTERWTLSSGEGPHVFHPHQIQFQILTINGEPPPPEASGWEDSVLVTAESEVVIAARFNSYTTDDIPYMFHCHILDHEDLGMMGQFLVTDE